MLNCLNLVGRLTKDPELKALGDNNVVAKFTVAVDRNYKDKDGNWLKQSTTRKVPEDEVPEAIRMSIRKQEAEKKQKADITDEMKPLLTLENSN